MATVMIADFSGMLPLREPLLLPDNNSQFAQNCWLYRGQVRGFRRGSIAYTLKYADTQQVYRIPLNTTNPPDFSSAGSLWLEFPDPYMKVIRNPTVGDTFNRYYFFPSDQYNSTGTNPMWPVASPGPMYNTVGRLQAGSPNYKLGIPVPTTAPTVTPAAMAGTNETRAYLYTYVSTYSEEGQPGPATVATGATTGTWTIVIPAPPAGINTNRVLAFYRLYRTVTDTSGNATYYQVAMVPINFSGTVTVTDAALDASLTANLILGTINYAAPPAGLQGVVMMANGIAAGFTNSREIWFSAAFLPHAWPASYALTVDYPIVGLTANGGALNIVNEGSPFMAIGVTPDTMTIDKISSNEPCVARGSIVAAAEGAYYASPNGIQLLNTSGTTNITAGIYEKEFHNTLEPKNWAAAKYGASIVAFFKGAGIVSPVDPTNLLQGVILDEQDANVPLTYLDTHTSVINTYSDELSGQVFRIDAGVGGGMGGVMVWNPPIVDGSGPTSLRDWIWKSKQFRFTAAQTFAAFIVFFDVPPEVSITPGVRNTSQTQVYNPNTQYLIVRVYADGRFVVVREIQVTGETILIPAGFIAKLWEFQFEGIVSMKLFKVASSVKELRAA